jgi:hypothetical protein
VYQIAGPTKIVGPTSARLRQAKRIGQTIGASWSSGELFLPDVAGKNFARRLFYAKNL